MAQESASSGGIGFSGLLTIAFIVLKLAHVIDWSWWWVLAPALAPVAIVVLLVFICGLRVPIRVTRQ